MALTLCNVPFTVSSYRCIILEPLCADFYGVRAVGSARPVPFIDAVTVTIWIHAGETDDNSEQKGDGDNEKKRNSSDSSVQQPTSANLHAIVHVKHLVSLQINHYQFLFLLRIADEANEVCCNVRIIS